MKLFVTNILYEFQWVTFLLASVSQIDGKYLIFFVFFATNDMIMILLYYIMESTVDS